MTAKDLKNALLQEAVMGKLVPQIASEGNARDLLEEIKKAKGGGEGLPLAPERKRSSATPSAGTPRNAPRISDEEVPFDIPESWCWCRLDDIASITTGMTPLKSEIKFYKDGKIPWITSSLTNKEYIESAESFITDYALENTSLTLYPKNTLILAMYGQGKTRGQISELLFPATINQACAAIELFIDDEYLRKYIKLFHNWNYENIRKEASGSAQPNLNLGKVQSTLIPLPPLAEQKRIVAAIEKFMPLIEEYGKKESALNLLNTQIASLTKKAILQESVQGRLVPQIATEGNAKDLLAEIKKSHTDLQISTKSAGAKSDLRSKSQIRVTKKELPPITQEEIPFDIPESWCWCRLGEIGDWKSGSTPSRTKPEFYNGNIPWLKTGDLNDGYITEIPEFVSDLALENCSMRLNPVGSVLIAMYGATIGKVGILNIPATTNQACCACICPDGLFNKYLFYYLMSQKTSFTEQAEGGAQPNISREKIVNYLIPLPPLAEQKRIVSAIEKLLPLCKKLGQ